MGQEARRTPRKAGSRSVKAPGIGDNPEAGRNPASTGTGQAEPGKSAGEAGGITIVKPGEAEAVGVGLAPVGSAEGSPTRGKTTPEKPEIPTPDKGKKKQAPNPLKGQTGGKGKSKTHDRDIAVGMTGAVLSGAFGILAGRLGAHWMLTPEETKKLAEPTVALFERYGLLEKLAMQSEWTAMFAALGIVVFPKATVTYQLSQMKKQAAKRPPQAQPQQGGGQPNVRNFQSIPGGKPGPVPTSSAHAGSVGEVQRAAPDHGADNVKGFLADAGFGIG